MKKTIGILAHVDAGKTTFSEQVLYLSNAIRKLGRVDHQDAFLDTHPLEKRRGITIFSGQARFALGDDEIRWLDTPGHVDFSPEMERALSVMDYAVLLISAAEGVQSHAETLWRLLADYGVPTFLFLNKTDREAADANQVLAQLKRSFSPDIVDMRVWQAGGDMDATLTEELASRDERLMDTLFSTGYDAALWLQSTVEQIKSRRLFPVFAGSALTGEGVSGFLERLNQLTVTSYDDAAPFSARVYQVRHDANGQRLCFLKLLGGSLRVKDELPGADKVNELRLYHGARYQTVDTIAAGELVAIPDAEGLHAGDLLGAGAGHKALRTEPMMAADVQYDPVNTPPPKLMAALRALEEEEPTLSVESREGVITLRVMGRIQLEVIKSEMQERYGMDIAFGPCRVLYMETISAPCVGVGHYEPLRHYAEVHVRLRPAPRGSGVSFRSLCHVDDLTLNWQRLIRQHVMEKAHRGVMSGAPLTDITCELLSGRAHLKHTEGGDFRQATYRAIRNALMYGQSVLLEPICRFRLGVPATLAGRLSGDLARMGAQTDAPEYDSDRATVTGTAVWSLMMDYQEAFLSLTHGKGSFYCKPDHYAPCHNAEEVVAACGYDPLADDTPDSVFCQKGAGYNVPWNEVRAHAHLPVEEE